MYRLFKKKISAGDASTALLSSLVRADDCWRDVCKLRDYEVPGPIATCEMSFARTAIIKDVIRRCQPEPVAEAMLAAVDKMVVEGFSGQDNEISLNYYHNERLSDVAPRTIRYYEENVFPLTHLAMHFANRISVAGAFSMIEIAPLFERVATDAERAMKSVKIVLTA